MSVQQNHYVMLAARFEADDTRLNPKILDNDFDKYEPYLDSAFKGIQHHNGLCIICDGMSGTYVYVGYVLQKSEDYGAIDDYMNTDCAPTCREVSERIQKEFGISTLCDLHAFTHYR